MSTIFAEFDVILLNYPEGNHFDDKLHVEIFGLVNQLDNLRKHFTTWQKAAKSVKIGAFYKVSIIAVKRWEITLIIDTQKRVWRVTPIFTA